MLTDGAIFTTVNPGVPFIVSISYQCCTISGEGLQSGYILGHKERKTIDFLRFYYRIKFLSLHRY